MITLLFVTNTVSLLAALFVLATISTYPKHAEFGRKQMLIPWALLAFIQTTDLVALLFGP